MSRGLLLDTHALLWIEGGVALRASALSIIVEAGSSRALFVSHISLWEVGVAIGKNRVEQRPDLRGLSPPVWLEQTTKQFGIRLLDISRRIAYEASLVPAIYGSGDPGDCFLIATARVRKLTLVTRDAKMLDLARRSSDYLQAIEC